MTDSKNHCWLSDKSMTSNFVADVSVYLPICCHIGLGMPYPCIFVEEVVTLLGAITDYHIMDVNTCLWSELEDKQDQVKVAANKYKR